MKHCVSFFAILAFGTVSALPRSHAQVLSPDKGIDAVDVITVAGVVDKVTVNRSGDSSGMAEGLPRATERVLQAEGTEALTKALKVPLRDTPYGRP